MVSYCTFCRGEIWELADRFPARHAEIRDTTAAKTAAPKRVGQGVVDGGKMWATVVTVDLALGYMKRRWRELEPVGAALKRSKEGPPAGAALR